MRKMIAVGVAGAMALAVSGRAEAAEGTGIEVGGRLGFGLPMGALDGASGDDLSKDISNMVPIWLDAGYRITPNIYAGAYFMYGFGSTGSNLSAPCSAPMVGCSLHDTRFGVNAHYHILPAGPLDPWVGAGIGFEWAALNESRGNVSGGVGFSGWEFLNIQAGADYKATPNLGVGPFLALTFAQFDTGTFSDAAVLNGVTSTPINNKGLHEWLIFGIRGAYDISLF